MIEVPISIDDIYKARLMSDEMGCLNNSISAGGGNIYGFLGEILVSNYLELPLGNTYDYDMKTAAGKTLDVKSKRCTSKPKPTYECSVAAFNTKQRCDYYVFTRVLSSLTKGWLLGYKPKEEYFSKATLLKKGTLDPSNNFTVRADCHNLEIGSLDSMEDLKKLLTNSSK